MGFLEAPHVQRSLEEASFLRERLINLTDRLQESSGLDVQIALEYLHTLYALVEKEHMLHTRFRLSNDQEALIAASELDGARIAADSDDFINGDHFYRALKEDIRNALQGMDDTDLDTPIDFT
jgi:hypothetical protein